MFSFHACSKHNACNLVLSSKENLLAVIILSRLLSKYRLFAYNSVVMIINVDTVFFVTRHFAAEDKQAVTDRRYHLPARALPCTLGDLFICMIKCGIEENLLGSPAHAPCEVIMGH